MLRIITIIILMAIMGFNLSAQYDVGNQREKEVKERISNLLKSGKITQEEADKMFYAEMQKYLSEQNVPIEFYGKVIDQEGEAVVDADVICSIGYYTLDPENYKDFNYGKVKTDQNGIFEVKAKSGISIRVTAIKKDGYEDSYNATNKGAKYTKKGYIFEHKGEIPKQPGPNNPEIFKIRKKGEPTILLTSGDDRKLQFDKGEAIQRSYALSLPGYWESGVGNDPLEKIKKKGYAANLVVTARQDNGSYKVQFKALGEKEAGIIVSDNLLYSAPIEGYQDVCEMEVNESGQTRKTIFIYARTGSPLVYSRLEMRVSITNTGLLLLYDNSRTNAYGERELERGEYMSYSENYDVLQKEAAQALKSGKYPPKPDFKALEAEGKKEYLKTHKDAR